MSKNRTFKDFLYDKNDVIIAFIIIAAAVAVIAWRVSIVMDYPSTLDSVATAEHAQSVAEEESLTAEEQQLAEWDDEGKLANDISVDLSSDSTEAAINSLVSAGLFSSSNEFKVVCKRINVSDADIKTGGFTFKQGDTKRDIAKQVTE